jgi:hypothetical protein
MAEGPMREALRFALCTKGELWLNKCGDSLVVGHEIASERSADAHQRWRCNDKWRSERCR